MSHLTPRERELVSLGAAMGSNCISCIEYHIPAARKSSLTDSQISEAIRLADRVRQVPARKVLDTALDLLSELAVTPVATATATQPTRAHTPAPAVIQAGQDKIVTAAQSSAAKPGCG